MFRSAALALVALGLWCGPAYAAESAALVGT